jgi:hypothetical protein
VRRAQIGTRTTLTLRIRCAAKTTRTTIKLKSTYL